MKDKEILRRCCSIIHSTVLLLDEMAKPEYSEQDMHDFVWSLESILEHAYDLKKGDVS